MSLYAITVPSIGRTGAIIPPSGRLRVANGMTGQITRTCR